MRNNSGAQAARKGGQAEPHTYHAEEKEIHELIFSWLSWLAVLFVGAYARRRRRCCPGVAQHCGHSPNKWHRLGLPCTSSLISDIHTGHNQVTLVKTRYPLTSIKWPYRGLKVTPHRGRMFLWSWLLTKCYFFDWIAGPCQVNLLKIGQDCSVAGLGI